MALTQLAGLPKQPQKPYIHERKQERKRPMTIAIGIHAFDGIILCSDSQLTVPLQMKYYDSKIRTIEHGEDWSCALTYSGDPERMQRICELMTDALHQSSEINENYVKSCLETALADVRDSGRSEYESIDVLCAFARRMTPAEEKWGDKGLHLFAGKNGAVTKPTNEFSVLGVGNSPLTRYLERLLLSSFGQAYVEYTMAMVIGAYIIEQAKQYIDGCGGNLQMCILRSGCKAKSHLHPIEMERIVGLGESLEAVMQKAVICGLGAEMELVNYEGDSIEQSLLDDLHKLRSDVSRLWRTT